MPKEGDYIDISGGTGKAEILGLIDGAEVYEVAEDAGGAEELISKLGVPSQMFKGLDWDVVIKGNRDLSFKYMDGKWTKWKDYGEEIGYTSWGRVEEKPKHEHTQRCQSRWAQVLESVKNVQRGEPDVKTDLESPEEVDAAAADLEAGAQRSLSKDYEDRVKETLLQNSANTKDYNAAKLEWDFINSWEDFPGQCELCGYNPIRYHFLIRNRLNGNELAVGSECIQNYLNISELGKTEIRLMVKRLKNISQEKRASQPDILDTESRVQMKFGQIRRVVANPETVKIPAALSILGRAAMSLQRFGLRLAKDLAAFLQKLRDAAARLRAKFKTLDYAEAANKIIRDEPDPTKAEKDLDDLNETIQLANKYGPEKELQERVKSSVDDAFKALPNRIRDIAFEIRRNLEAKLGEAEKVATAFPRVVNRIEDLRAKIHTTLDKMVRDILVQIAQGQPAELPTEKILKQTLNDEDRRWLEFMTETFLNPEGLPFEDVRSFLGVGADVQGPDMTSVERRMLWMQAYNENIYTSPTLPGKDIGMDDQMRDILFGINPIYEKLAMGGKSTSEVPMAENSDRAVAELQADPDFRALTPREQNFLMNFLSTVQGDSYADGANLQNDIRSYGYKNVTRLLSLHRRHYPNFVKK